MVDSGYDSIIASGSKVIKGIFMAVSYHIDLTRYQAIYNNDTKDITVLMGPQVKYIQKMKISDKKFSNCFGEKVVEELRKFALL